MSSEGYGYQESDEKSPLLSNTTTNSVSQNVSPSGFTSTGSPSVLYGRGSPNIFTNRRSPNRPSRSSTPTVSSQLLPSCNENDRAVSQYDALGTSANNVSRDTRDNGETKKSSKESSETDSESSDGTPVRSFSFFSLPRKHKLILASVCMADFLSYLSLSLLAPFFPQEASNKSVNDTISGWIFGVFALSQVLFSPVFGKILPHVGLKFMYVSGLFLSGGTTVLFGCLDYINTDQENMTFVIFCFVLRVVLSVGCTSLNTSCYALIAKQFPDHIGTVFGIGEVFVGLGFMSGPAIGGVLYGLGGFVMPFFVIGSVLLLCVPVNYFILPPDEDFQPNESSVSSMVLFRSPTVIIVSLAIVVAAFIWSILDPTLEPHLREFDLGPEVVGLLFLLMSAFYAISSPIWGWVADKVSDNRTLLMIGFFFSSGGMLVLGPSTLVGFPSDYNELWLNILALCYLGVSASLALIPTFDIFLDVADELGFEEDMHTYGLVAGLWGSMYAFGDFLGPSLGGFLLENFGFQWCCTITAFACLAMIPLLFFNWMYDKCCKKKKKVPPKTVSSEPIAEENRNRVFTTSSIDAVTVPVDSWVPDNQEDNNTNSSVPRNHGESTEVKESQISNSASVVTVPVDNWVPDPQENSDMMASFPPKR